MKKILKYFELSPDMLEFSRSHALRGNASWTLCVLCLVLTRQGTQSVPDAFPRKAWEREGSDDNNYAMKNHN